MRRLRIGWRQRRALLAAAQAGASRMDIARQFGVSPSTAWWIMHQHSLSVHPVWGKAGVSTDALDWLRDELDEVWERLLASEPAIGSADEAAIFARMRLLNALDDQIADALTARGRLPSTATHEEVE